MDNSTLATYIGVLAGAIFFIDGWGPSEKGTGFFKSRRFRGLSIIISGSIITPLLDYFNKNDKPLFFLNYVKGCVIGWFFVFTLGLVLYLLWIKTKPFKKGKAFWIGELAYSILDFIYLGISDNPHLDAKRKHEINIYEAESTSELKRLKNVLRELETTPKKLDQETIKKVEYFGKELQSTKTENDYDFEDWFYKGISEYEKKEYEKSIAYMKNSIDKSTDQNELVNALLYIGIAYIDLKLYLKAFNIFTEITTKYSSYSDMDMAYYNKGIVLFELKRYQASLESFEKAIELNKNDGDYWSYKGDVLNELGRHEDASKFYEISIRVYEISISSNPSYSTYWSGKADALFSLKRYEEALISYETAINLDSNDPENWLGKGNALVELKRHQEALEAYDRAINLDSNNSEYWLNKGNLLLELKRYQEALEAYDQALKLDSSNSEGWYFKGYLLQELKRYGEALEAYEEAIRLNLNDIDSIYNIACIYSLLNNKSEALKYLRKAIQLNKSQKEEAKTDVDFDNIKNEDEFKKLIE